MVWNHQGSNFPCRERSDQIRSDQSLSRVWFFATPWIAARQASLSITNSRSSLRLTSIESVVPSSHLILCRPLLLLPPIPPSIRVFSNESTLRMRWPKNGKCYYKEPSTWVSGTCDHKPGAAPTASQQPAQLYTLTKAARYCLQCALLVCGHRNCVREPELVN